MNDSSTVINQHYGQDGLGERILDALKRAGKDIDALTVRDLMPLDQLHSGGHHSTRLLAQLAGLKPGMDILDIGSGLGGPARILAAEFGCQVTALDLTESFRHAAELLTSKVGLQEKVHFYLGDALDIPFNAEQFDVVWTQSTLMNIPEKDRFLQESFRVLKSGGLLVIQTHLAGKEPAVYFPYLWAEHPTLNFLDQPDIFRQQILATGFTEVVWQDVTAQDIESGRRSLVYFKKNGLPPLGVHLIISDIELKIGNVLRSLEEGMLTTVQAVYRKG